MTGKLTKAQRRSVDLLKAVRRFMTAELRHARLTERERRLGLRRESTTSRDETDLAHADIFAAFTPKDCDAAMRLIRAALEAQPTPDTETDDGI